MKFNLLLIIFISGFSFAQSPFIFRDNPVVETPSDMNNEFLFIDLDNDGDKDLVNILNDKLRFYQSNGNSIDSLNPIVLALPHADVEFVDWDLDSLIDIVATSGISSYEIKLFKNMGNMIFSAPVVLYSGSIARLDTADFNSDGYPDLISARLNSVTFFENLTGTNSINTSTFTLSYNVDGSNIVSVLFDDINLDGLKDLIIKPNSNKVYIYSNTGANNYIIQDSISSTNAGLIDSYQSLFLKDLDNDGKNEIITRNKQFFNIFKWQLGYHFQLVYTGDFTYTVSGGATINNQMPISDFYDVDQNGLIDVVGGNYVFFNNGGFVFNKVSINTPAILSSPRYKCSDINNNSLTDICYVYTDANCITSTNAFEAFYRSESNAGQIIAPNNIIWHLWGGNASSIVDFDNDGDIDVVDFNRGKLILKENINDTLFPKIIGNGSAISIYNTLRTDFVDINHDGFKDLLFHNANDLGADYHYYRLNQNGTIIGAGGTLANNEMSLKLIEDIDDDGWEELFYVRFNGSNHYLYIYKTSTSGPVLISTVTMSVPLMEGAEVRLGDFDLDGKKDVVVRLINGSGGYNRFYIIKNNGSNSFSIVQNFQQSSGTLIGLANCDSDQYPEIIIHNGTNKLLSYKNNQSVFSTSTSNLINTAALVGSPTGYVMDFDGDDLNDMVVQDNSKQLLFRNNGSNDFMPVSNISGTAKLIRINDLDQDGDNDIMSEASWYENTSNGLFNAHGFVYHDSNENGVYDTLTDFPLPYFPIQMNSGSNIYYTGSNGTIDIELGSVESIYQFGIAPITTNQVTPTTAPYPAAVVINYSNPTGEFQLGINADSIELDDQFDITLVGNRCNESGVIYINYSNSIEQVIHAEVNLQLADHSSFQFSNESNTQLGNLITWNLDTLNPFEQIRFYSGITLPSTSFMGDTMHFNARLILETSSGIDTLYDEINQILTCAYDPNDKQITMNDNVIFGDSTFVMTDDLEYTIRFQNTGNDSAINVVLADNLSNLFDWTTVRPISASHPYYFSVDNNGKITIEFININLPDSSTDFTGSMGYIKFQVKYKSTSPKNTLVNNYAKIYFDQNPPIYTNVCPFYRLDCSSFVGVSVTNNSLCENSNLEVANIPNSFLAFDYLWEIDNQTISTRTGTISNLNAGNQELYYKMENQLCVFDTTINILVKPKPNIIVNVQTDIVVCNGDSLDISSNHLLNWYEYNTSLQSMSFLLTDSILSNSYTSNKSIIGIANVDGCTDTVHINIQVPHLMSDLFLKASWPMCFNDTVQLQSYYGNLEWSYYYNNNPGIVYSDTGSVLNIVMSSSSVSIAGLTYQEGCPLYDTHIMHPMSLVNTSNLVLNYYYYPYSYSPFSTQPLNMDDTIYVCSPYILKLGSPLNPINWYRNDTLLAYSEFYTPDVSGTYQLGCEKIPVTIMFNTPHVITETVNTCIGSDYIFPDGTEINDIQGDLIHVSTITHTNECDSVISTHLIVNQPTLLIDTVYLCFESIYTFPDGFVLTGFSNSFNEYFSHFPNQDGCDTLLIKTVLLEQPFTSTNETVYVCQGEDYIFPDGSMLTNLDLNTQHTSWLYNSLGCDSANVNTTVIIKNLDDYIVTQQDSTVYVYNTIANSAQWLDCNNNYAPVIGANDFVLFPTPHDGSYAVQLFYDECIDTSECFMMFPLYLNDLNQSFNYYPNPVNEVLTIQLPSKTDQTEVILFDVNGKELTKQTFFGKEKLNVAMDSLSSGIYLVKIRNNQLEQNIRVEKID